MLKPETVGAVIALYTEDRDDFDAETIRGIIENAYKLMDEKKHVSVKLESIKKILEDFISKGYVQKSGDTYLVTTQGRQVFKDMWRSLDSVTEAYFVGGYMYYVPKQKKAENKQRNTRDQPQKKETTPTPRRQKSTHFIKAIDPPAIAEKSSKKPATSRS